MRLALALVLVALAACAVIGCVRYVDLQPVETPIDAPWHPDAAIDADIDAPGVAPQGLHGAAAEAM